MEIVAYIILILIVLMLWGIRWSPNKPSVIETLLDIDIDKDKTQELPKPEINPYMQQRLDEARRGRQIERNVIAYRQRKSEEQNNG